MKFIIEDKAKNYILKKNIKEIAVSVKAFSCWGGPQNVATVTVGKPKKLDEYNHFSTEELEIYVHKSVRLKEDYLTIDLEGFLFLKSLTVHGISLFF